MLFAQDSPLLSLLEHLRFEVVKTSPITIHHFELLPAKAKLASAPEDKS